MQGFQGIYEIVVDDNIRLLRECQALLAPVTDARYRASVDHAPENSVGRQVRHCIDHYICLLGGIETGAVDYDDRSRDATLEMYPEQARQALESLCARLSRLTPQERRRSLEVKLDKGIGAPSSVARELEFLVSHTTHHLALIAELGRHLGLSLDADLGVSNSTQRAREMQA